MSIVHVIAVLTAHPGRRNEVLALFNDIVPTVLAEDGCIAYEATVDTKDAAPRRLNLARTRLSLLKNGQV